MQVNEQDYWENRFASKDWEQNNGREQTEYFGMLLLEHLPRWLKSEWAQKAYSICDMGCAEGDCAGLLAQQFPCSEIFGADFSRSALDLGRQNYPSVRFLQDDIYTSDKQYDVIILSNVLEHLEQPERVLCRLLRNARKYVAVMVPLDDDFSIAEHINHFSFDSFQNQYSEGTLCYHEWIYCGHPIWPGYQLLMVYATGGDISHAYMLSEIAGGAWEKDAFVKMDRKRKELENQLAENSNQLESFTQKIRELEDQKEESQNKIKDLMEQNGQAQNEISELAEQNTELHRKIQEMAEVNTKLQDDLRNQIDYLRADYTVLQKEKADCDSYLSEQSNFIQAQSAAIRRVLELCRLMLAAPAFKALHLWGRIKKQLIAGDLSEKKKFFSWLIHRSATVTDGDHRFSPLFSIYDTLNSVGAISQKKVDAFSSIETYKKSFSIDAPAELKNTYNKFDVIILSIIVYNSRYQRPQHIASRFAKDGHRVFYVNSSFCSGKLISSVEKNLYTVNIDCPEILDIYHANLSDSEDTTENVIHKFDSFLNGYAIRDAVVLVDYPNWLPIACYLRNKYGFKIVTDYMDDFTGFLDTTSDQLRSNCIRLLEKSDFVVASSQFLYNIAIQYNEKCDIIRNGCEYELFSQGFSDAGNHEKKIIGYYGAVAHWFDYKKALAAADRFPECDIIVIGEVTSWKEKLEEKKNIILLGEKEYKTLPNYLAEFDVCLIPFDTSTDLIKATNPVKFYEYLCAGKKIVATEIPELMPYRDKYVYMSNNDQEFCDYIKLCLDGRDSLASETERVLFAQQNDWNERYNMFYSSVRKAIPKVSIIIITYNNLSYNIACLQSILSKTAYANYEVIIVDNLSTDGTREWLQQIQSYNDPKIKVILNERNVGFAGGNNIGIKNSTGNYIVLLNNDTLVTRGWLTNFVKHIENDTSIGMVGAITNSTGNEGMIACAYTNCEEMDAFSFAHTTQNMGKHYSDVSMLAMFATLIPRRIIDECGLLDENYGLGMFEDDDYAEAVKNKGYSLIIAEDVFIHHFQSLSFSKLSSEKYRETFQKNKAYFEMKWRKSWKEAHRRFGITADTNKDVRITNLYQGQLFEMLEQGDTNGESERFFEMLRKEIAGKRVVIFSPTIDWNMPMFQRPQQLACAYARKENMIVIYLTPNYMYEKINVAQMPRSNLWVVNAEFSEQINNTIKYAQEVILSIVWATNRIYLEKIYADKIIYEYIDDLTIFNGYGPELIQMHEDLLHRANLTVCTASSLYDQVKKQAQKAIVSTNACDYELFKTTPEAYVLPEIQKLAEMYSHVIGYYGALAKWFDYDLVKQVAQKRPDWLWLLVGIDYDNSMEKAELNKYPNIVYAGLQPYEKLPGFLKVFDVATLPFKINDITKGTSPVKIFEYMAGNKPIVTAQLPECMKYDSIFTYQDADDFCRQVEKVIALKPDDPYWETLKRDALHNTWDVKTDEILAALSNESN